MSLGSAHRQRPRSAPELALPPSSLVQRLARLRLPPRPLARDPVNLRFSVYGTTESRYRRPPPGVEDAATAAAVSLETATTST